MAPLPRPPELRPAPILAALARHDVAYITIGSYAAILQDVDLPMTDIDIVPANSSENRHRLVAALRDLNAVEAVGEGEEPLDDLVANPDSVGDSTFRTFITEFGGVDVVNRPAGFPNGYDDLLAASHVATIQDDREPSFTVDAKIADVQDVYRSKQQAGRAKDIKALAAFVGIHPQDVKVNLRARYRAERPTRGDD